MTRIKNLSIIFFLSRSKSLQGFFVPDKKFSPGYRLVGFHFWFHVVILILICILTFKILITNNIYHQYRKKWTSKPGVNSNFYLIERELWQNLEFRFFRFCVVILLKNITKISKKVNLQNWCQFNFLLNIKRVMGEFRFFRFWVVIWLKKITNIEKSEPPKLVSTRLFT